MSPNLAASTFTFTLNEILSYDGTKESALVYMYVLVHEQATAFLVLDNHLLLLS